MKNSMKIEDLISKKRVIYSYKNYELRVPRGQELVNLMLNPKYKNGDEDFKKVAFFCYVTNFTADEVSYLSRGIGEKDLINAYCDMYNISERLRHKIEKKVKRKLFFVNLKFKIKKLFKK